MPLQVVSAAFADDGVVRLLKNKMHSCARNHPASEEAPSPEVSMKPALAVYPGLPRIPSDTIGNNREREGERDFGGRSLCSHDDDDDEKYLREFWVPEDRLNGGVISPTTIGSPRHLERRRDTGAGAREGDAEGGVLRLPDPHLRGVVRSEPDGISTTLAEASEAFPLLEGGSGEKSAYRTDAEMESEENFDRFSVPSDPSTTIDRVLGSCEGDGDVYGCPSSGTTTVVDHLVQSEGTTACSFRLGDDLLAAEGLTATSKNPENISNDVDTTKSCDHAEQSLYPVAEQAVGPSSAVERVAEVAPSVCSVIDSLPSKQRADCEEGRVNVTKVVRAAAQQKGLVVEADYDTGGDAVSTATTINSEDTTVVQIGTSDRLDADRGVLSAAPTASKETEDAAEIGEAGAYNPRVTFAAVPESQEEPALGGGAELPSSVEKSRSAVNRRVELVGESLSCDEQTSDTVEEDNYASDVFEKKSVHFSDESLWPVHEVRASFERHELAELFYTVAELDRMLEEVELEEQVDTRTPQEDWEECRDSHVSSGEEVDLADDVLAGAEDVLFESFSFDDEDSNDHF